MEGVDKMGQEKYAELVEQAAQAIIDEKPEATPEARDELLKRFFGEEVPETTRRDVAAAHIKKMMERGGKFFKK